MKIKTLFVWLLLITSLVACRKTDPVVPDQTVDEIRFTIPDGFPQPVYQFEFNPLTKKGFELGRQLFYDPVLSVDNSVSCGSCHQQFSAFSHFGHKVSHGINNLLGNRNAPPLFNLPWQPNLMWDGGVHNLELQPLGPITNPVEMGETLENVLAKLQADPKYPGLFREAFGSDSITSQHMFKAMAQFMGIFTSSHSRYDAYMKGQESFTEEEKNGMQVFRQQCESCHREPLFSDYSFRNNGLDLVFADSGRARITLDPMDMGKFKMPSLRNIEITGPYMHDGRLASLEDVVEHYRSGIKVTSTLDSSLVNGITLSDTEKNDLVLFLKTLTDDSFVADTRFSQPPK